MKRINNYKIVITTITFCLLYLHSAAQKKQFLGVWGAGGYSSMPHNIENTKISGGIGYSMGAGYEYNLNQFILLSGFEFTRLSSKTNMNGYTENHNFQYPYLDNYYISYHFSFLKYQEKYSVGYLNIPVQLGMNFKRYYALIGVRVGLNLFGNCHVTSQLETTATDPMFVDDLSNIPSHYLGSTIANEKDKLSLGLNISPGLEFGVVLDEWLGRGFTQLNNRNRTPVSYRAGLFVDYGVVNLNKANTVNKILNVPEDLVLTIPEPNSSNPLDIKVNNLQSSTLAKDKRLGDVFIGVKLTVLFDFTKVAPKPKPLKQPKPQSKPKPKPQPVTVPVFYVHVVDAESNDNLTAEITVSSIPENHQIFKKETYKFTGMISQELKVGKYQVHVTAEGHLYYLDIFDHCKNDTLLVALQAIKKDTKVILHNVFFEFNSDSIRSESEPALDELYQFLKDNPDMRIQIVGHTDNIGSVEYNQNLSKNRAKAIHDALIQKGIDPSRLDWLGKGSSEPIAPNDTEEGRAKNRRVEFVIQ